jgi:antirestriction protein
MQNQKGEIRIYVACPEAYNHDILHGCWIDAGQEPAAIRSAISAMLATSPMAGAEEYVIHDYEGFEGAYIGEYADIEGVAALAAFIAEYGALGGKLVEYFGDVDDAREAMEERYYGEYKRLSDFVEESIGNSYDIPDALRAYIDYEAMARDWAINDILTIETGFECVHVFWRH